MKMVLDPRTFYYYYYKLTLNRPTCVLSVINTFLGRHRLQIKIYKKI